ncbi:nitroreductase family protein [Bifidobacterium animalis]|uniref:nitroreductase family protein n=1 Tax=Bifidobacterium animalis TaxID=28025 RepID=UPI001C3EF51A|nr:nitroreductase family protein [Bifidobacterium animalis]MCR1996020.1 nitroreductase family protein [Bifidobacterium animalis subsp. animalis]
MKNTIKRLIPAGMKRKLQSLENEHRVRGYFKVQARDIDKYFAFPDNTGQRQIETQLLFFSHQLEKGLSHSNFRSGFGRRPLTMILDLLDTYRKKGYNPNTFELEVTYSVLKAYRERHLGNGYEMPMAFSAIYGKYNKEIDGAESDLGGAKEIHADASYDKTYCNVIENRVSIREFGSGPVDVNLIDNALKVAVHAPSVCNRQSQNVRVVLNPEKIHQVLRIQGGWNGYKDPPALLLMTSHLSSFNNAVERNEPYVDGGIFSMALLGALEEQNLAACPLNAMFSKEQDDGVRGILAVPREEVMVMFIALGNKPEQVLHPISSRRDYRSIVQYID